MRIGRASYAQGAYQPWEQDNPRLRDTPRGVDRVGADAARAPGALQALVASNPRSDHLKGGVARIAVDAEVPDQQRPL